MEPTTTKCCKKCKAKYLIDTETGPAHGYRCVNEDCPCHTTTPETGWRERFDSKFVKDGELNRQRWGVRTIHGHIKEFIEAEFHIEKERTLARVQQKLRLWRPVFYRKEVTDEDLTFIIKAIHEP